MYAPAEGSRCSEFRRDAPECLEAARDAVFLLDRVGRTSESAILYILLMRAVSRAEEWGIYAQGANRNNVR